VGDVARALGGAEGVGPFGVAGFVRVVDVGVGVYDLHVALAPYGQDFYKINGILKDLQDLFWIHKLSPYFFNSPSIHSRALILDPL
jgi:hypothetical protein